LIQKLPLIADDKTGSNKRVILLPFQVMTRKK
jgi:hypothetical protein